MYRQSALLAYTHVRPYIYMDWFSHIAVSQQRCSQSRWDLPLQANVCLFWGSILIPFIHSKWKANRKISTNNVFFTLDKFLFAKKKGNSKTSSQLKEIYSCSNQYVEINLFADRNKNTQKRFTPTGVY
jgi:hypothetical protein